jgi:hypothetical protein
MADSIGSTEKTAAGSARPRASARVLFPVPGNPDSRIIISTSCPRDRSSGRAVDPGLKDPGSS